MSAPTFESPFASSIKTYAYSFDRSTFRGDFATRELALDAGLRAAASRSSVEAVFVGKRAPTDPQADHHADEVVKSMRRRMQSTTGEASYLSTANEHLLADLDAKLAGAIVAWLSKNGLTPASKITSISEHTMPTVHAHGPSRNDEVQSIGPEE